jgi:hypothetical protein
MQPSTPALVSPAPTDNLAIALGVVTPGDWLRQVDVANQATFEHFLAHGRFHEAFEFMLGHLQRTEVTRTRELGAGPSWAAAVEAFNAAAHRQLLPLVVGGVNATRTPAAYRGSGNEGRPPTAGSVNGPAGSCAPDVPTLVPLAGALCGHVDALTGLTCCTDAHPRNPGGHYYRSSAGSDVADRHSRTEAQED